MLRQLAGKSGTAPREQLSRDSGNTVADRTPPADRKRVQTPFTNRTRKAQPPRPSPCGTSPQSPRTSAGDHAAARHTAQSGPHTAARSATTTHQSTTRPDQRPGDPHGTAWADLIPTAKAQRWEPAEVVRVLLAEEAAGRDRANLHTRRQRAGFPTGKTFGDWDEMKVVHSPPHAGRAHNPRMDRPPGELLHWRSATRRRSPSPSSTSGCDRYSDP